MKLLENKVALVTGARRGIGEAVAIKFAEHGASIAFTYLSSEERAKALEEKFIALGVKAKGYKSDAGDYKAAEQLAIDVTKDFGTIDICVNNAGISKDNLLLRLTPEQWDYAASKAGIIGFTKSIAQEIGSRNIRCNAIAPGFIETDMTHYLKDGGAEKWFEKIPLGRFGKPEEVANVALFLACDMSIYMTGQVLSVCGGMST